MTRATTLFAVDPGRMRRRIELQVQSTDQDQFGQPLQVWTTALTAYAAIEPVRGIDIIRSGQETKQTRWTVTMYWQAGVSLAMRVLTDDGENYIIESIEDPLKLNFYLILNCLALNEQTA